MVCMIWTYSDGVCDMDIVMVGVHRLLDTQLSVPRLMPSQYARGQWVCVCLFGRVLRAKWPHLTLTWHTPTSQR